MEHRCGVRRTLGVTVLVRRRGWAGSVVAELTSLSISGAYIEAPPGTFPLYSVVQIETSRPGAASTRLLTCKAMVARVGANGVGLVFDQIRPRGLAALFAADSPPLNSQPSSPPLRPNASPAPP